MYGVLSTYTLYTLHFTMYNVHYKHVTFDSTMIHHAKMKLISYASALCIINRYTVNSVYCTLYNVHCTLYSIVHKKDIRMY